MFVSLFFPCLPASVLSGKGQVQEHRDTDSKVPDTLAAVMNKQNITCGSLRFQVANAAQNCSQPQLSGLLSHVAHAAPDCSPSQSQLGSIRFHVANAAPNCLQPQLSSLLSQVANAASDCSLSQSGSPSLSTVANAASDFDGSLDLGLSQTRLQAIPETGSVIPNKDITECKHADNMSVNNETSLLTQHFSFSHVDNKETSTNEVSRGEVTVNDSCLDQVSINSEMCVSEQLLTQHLRLTHFDNNETAENEVSRSEVAVNEACKHEVSNDPSALLRVGIDLFNVFDTGINSKMPENCIDALAQLHGLGCTVTVLCSIGEHSRERIALSNKFIQQSNNTLFNKCPQLGLDFLGLQHVSNECGRNSKSQWLKQHRYGFHIDDNNQTCRECTNAGITALAIKTRHEQHKSLPLAYNNLADALAVVIERIQESKRGNRLRSCSSRCAPEVDPVRCPRIVRVAGLVMHSSTFTPPASSEDGNGSSSMSTSLMLSSSSNEPTAPRTAALMMLPDAPYLR